MMHRTLLILISLFVLSACGGGGGGNGNVDPDPPQVNIELAIQNDREANWIGLNGSEEIGSARLHLLGKYEGDADFREMTKQNIEWVIVDGAEFIDMERLGRQAVIHARKPCEENEPFGECVIVKAVMRDAYNREYSKTISFIVKDNPLNWKPSLVMSQVEPVNGNQEYCISNSIFNAIDYDGSVKEYFWTILDPDYGAAFVDSGESTSKLDHPCISLPALREEVSLSLSVMVWDDAMSSTSGQVDINIQPSLENQPPVAMADKTQITVIQGSDVTLGCSKSTDPDGDPLSECLWQQVSKDSDTCPDLDLSSASLIAPEVSETCTYSINFTVSDGSLSDSLDDNQLISLTIYPPGINMQPTVDIVLYPADLSSSEGTQNLTFSEGSEICAEAINIDDDSGVSLIPSWVIPVPDISPEEGAFVQCFELPSVDTITNYSISVQVQEVGTVEEHISQPAVATLTVEPANFNPFASLEAFSAGQTITLDASQSDDPDGEIVKYNWSCQAGRDLPSDLIYSPANETTNPQVTVTSPLVGTDVTFACEVRVTDNEADSEFGYDTATADVTIPKQDLIITNLAGTIVDENTIDLTWGLENSPAVEGIELAYEIYQAGQSASLKTVTASSHELVTTTLDNISSGDTYTLTVKVLYQDKILANESDPLILTPVDGKPSAAITVENGLTISNYETIILNGSNSSDTDPNNPLGQGTITDYQWRIVTTSIADIKDEIDLSSSNEQASFLPPVYGQDYTVTVGLVVTDNDQQESPEAQKTITIQSFTIAPENLDSTSNADKTAATVTWDAALPKTAGAISYRIERATSKDGIWEAVDSSISEFSSDTDTHSSYSATVPTYIQDGLTWIKVTAIYPDGINIAANSALTAAESANYDAKASITATVNNVNIILSASSDLEPGTSADSYEWSCYASVSSLSSMLSYTPITTINTTTVTAPLYGNDYDVYCSVTIKTVDADQVIDYVESALAKASISKQPLTPSTLTCSILDKDSVALNWKLTESATYSGTPITYAVYNKTLYGSTLLGTTQAYTSHSSIAYTLNNLNSGFSYQLIVRALYPNGPSGSTGSDSNTCSVTPKNTIPVAVARLATGHISPVTTYGTVVLDGSDSYDNDPIAPFNKAGIASYDWKLKSATVAGVSSLITLNKVGAQASFTTPVIDRSVELTFGLTVTDKDGGKSTEAPIKVVISPFDITPLNAALTQGTDKTQATITWTSPLPADSGISFRIESATSEDGTWSTYSSATISNSGQSYTAAISALPENAYTWLRVRAVYANNVSGPYSAAFRIGSMPNKLNPFIMNMMMEAFIE